MTDKHTQPGRDAEGRDPVLDEDIESLIERAEPGVRDLIDAYETVETIYFAAAKQPEPVTVYASNTGY